ncbi:hypothetical protein [Kribbella sindirgiensis]|uniref:Uncharacterized protein n=1 Tax=Kribbella sindirgiensis TaxID=1124744 RepID=A0A4R0I3Q1_9ACTN|nr:hypothetical protein [Kribbella sindirgiensis]TCC21653.1 hypothetical protein E0H50_35855 [Kribbella sindirgiensis]
MLFGLSVLALVAAAVVVTVLLVRPNEPAPVPLPQPESFAVTGAIVVEADILTSAQEVGGACVPEDGYDDIHAGTQVTVKDATAKVVALGKLQAGTVAELYGEDALPALLGFASKCTFSFTVTDVPGGQEIYSVEVSHRGDVRFSREQLNEELALTLG